MLPSQTLHNRSHGPCCPPQNMACPLPYSPSPDPGVTPDAPFLRSPHPNHQQGGTPYSMCPVPQLLSSPPCSHQAPRLPPLSLDQTPSLPSQSAPTTPHCRLGSQRVILLAVLGAGSLRSGCHGQVLLRTIFLACRYHLLAHVAERERKEGRQRKRVREHVSPSSYKGTNPITRAPPS